jgi:hypothetical protein
MARVLIPKNADDMIHLIDRILEKENNLDADATLSAEELQALAALRDTGKKANDAQQALRKQAEEEVVRRDNALGTGQNGRVNVPTSAKYLVAKLRDLLLAQNKTNPKVLGEWGFVVDSSPQAHPKNGDAAEC